MDAMKKLPISKSEYMSLDYETTGLNAYLGDRPFSYSLTNQNYDTYVGRVDWTKSATTKRDLTYLQNFFTDTTIHKVAHNAKFERTMSLIPKLIHVPSETIWDCTLILSKIVDNNLEDGGYKLEKLANRMVSDAEVKENWALADKGKSDDKKKLGKIFTKNGISEPKLKERLEQLKKEGITPIDITRSNYGLMRKDIMDTYQFADGERGMVLWNVLADNFGEDWVRKHYKLEMQLNNFAYDMEKFGVKLDIPYVKGVINRLEGPKTEALKNIRKYIPEEINLRGDKLPPYLYEELDFPIVDQKLCYTKKGKFSAGKKALVLIEEINKHPFIDHYLKWKSYESGITTLNKYISLADKNSIIHANQNTNQANTGRQSVSDPSLQNAAKNKSIGVRYTVPVRMCLTPHNRSILLAPDYSGIELRLVAAIAKCTALITSLKQNNEFDIHNYVGDIILPIGWKEHTDFKVIRGGLKNFDFAIPYGGDPLNLLSDLLLYYSKGEIMQGVNKYKKLHPEIYYFSKNQAEEFKLSTPNTDPVGFVKTLFDRKLYLDKYLAYIAANKKVQGTAATILKIAQIKAMEFIKKELYPHVQMIFPVHDEIVLNATHDFISNTTDYHQALMELDRIFTDFPSIPCPLHIGWKYAPHRFGETFEFKLKDVPDINFKNKPNNKTLLPHRPKYELLTRR